MNALLLRFALAFCPREFRDEYRDQIADFPAGHNLSTLVDILWTGFALHAENLGRDFGFALRTLRKAPLFVAVATLAIALAIGANVAVAAMICCSRSRLRMPIASWRSPARIEAAPDGPFPTRMRKTIREPRTRFAALRCSRRIWQR